MTQFALVHKQSQETILGSDQLIYLDGRLNIFNAIAEAKKKAARLKNVRSDIYSIRIYKGDLKQNHPVSGYHVIF